MADKRKKRSASSNRQPNHRGFSMGNYYDEENRRAERSYDRPAFRGYGGDTKSLSAANDQRKKKKKKRSRYRLAHPEKLIFSVGVLATCVVLLVVLIRSLGGSGTPTAEESYGSVQTVPHNTGETQTGTIRPVGTVKLDDMPEQLAAYMASMINTNPDNHGEVPEVKDPEPEVNLSINPDNYKFIVAIDAGHGGSDSGWTDGIAEKDIDMIMAEKIAAYINQNTTGYLAYMLRTGDTQMTDQLRVYRAQEIGAHLIVSIHCNGADFEIGGVSAAYWTGEGDSDERAAYSMELAANLMAATADGFGTWEQSLRIEDIPIVHTDVPSVLLEMGFITYPLDNDNLQDETKQDQAAAKIGSVIIDYIREVEPTLPPKTKAEDSENSTDDSQSDG